MEELKACPFCGGEAEHYGEVEGDFSIACLECDAGTKYCDTKQQAINAWNNRVEPSATLTCDLKDGEFTNGRR